MLKLIFVSFLCGISKKWGESLFILMFVFILLIVRRPIRHNLNWFNLELDTLGWLLISLRVWISLLATLSSIKIKVRTQLKNIYLFTLNSLLLFLILSFRVRDLIFFYLRFEACLIPILAIILGWGYQPERSTAGVYILFYTLFGSLPLFTGIIFIFETEGSLYLFDIIKWDGRGFFFILIVAAFLVKFPIYGAHLWLLKAHVEAPVAGSMLLAGILLKLGGYGIIRVISTILRAPIFKEIIISLRIWGAVITRIVCMRHTDIKLLIASSSVVHIRVCIAGLLIISEWGVKGCFVIILAHGLASSGLFCAANLVYTRTHRRSIFVNKGLLNLIPRIRLCWFLLIVRNIGGPPRLNLGGEIILINRILSWRFINIFPLVFLSFFRAAYRIYLFSLRQHGVFAKSISSLQRGFVLDFFLLIRHIIPVNFIILIFIYLFCFCSLN